MGKTKTYSTEVEEKVIYNYVNLKQGLQKAGKNYNIQQHGVENILKKYGIKKRTYHEAKDNRKYSCDDEYFKTQSHNMAYILGLLASDGGISRKENLISIQLLGTDQELLELVQKETKNTRPITNEVRKNTGHRIACFRCWSRNWKQDLAHYGIVPQKTFKLTPPDLLAEKYRKDYIRGYFDGDGSIYAVTSQNRIFVQFVGASKKAIEWIYDELVNHYHIYCNKVTTEVLPNGTVMYKFLIGSKKEVAKLYNLFYDDSTLYLKRKKEKFETLLDIPRDSNSLDKE